MKNKLFDDFMDNISTLNKNQVKILFEDLKHFNFGIPLPTDNLNDLTKAEFILENWNKIKIESINL
jgi:hypothetical protein